MTDVMYLPGVAGHYASAPDSAALSITGDIDIRCKVALNDWTPTGIQMFIAKKISTGNQRTFEFYINTTGTLVLTASPDGSATYTATSSVTNGVSDGTTKWIRATRAAATGTVKFYLSDGGSSWAQLGTDIATTASGLFDGTANVGIGANSDGAANAAAGRFYRVEIRNNILDDGTGIVFDADFTDRGNTFTEDSSNHATVTIWGRLQGYEPTWLPAEAIYGNASHYGYEARKLDAPEPAPKTTFPAATGGTTYPVAR